MIFKKRRGKSLLETKKKKDLKRERIFKVRRGKALMEPRYRKESKEDKGSQERNDLQGEKRKTVDGAHKQKE